MADLLKIFHAFQGVFDGSTFRVNEPEGGHVNVIVLEILQVKGFDILA